MWLDTFNEMRKKSEMSLDELSMKSGIPKGTLAKITSGITKAPPLETMRKLVYSMGYTLDDLDKGLAVSENFSKEEKEHIQKYRLLDQPWKEAVDNVLDIGHRCCTERASEAPAWEPEETVLFVVPWFFHPMSAGTGEEAINEQPEDLRLTKAPPRGTSYVAPVRGDSMEPTYHDGDKLFIRVQEEIEVGQIGVFFMDGKQWVKELGEGMLISHNPEYDPIPMREDIRPQGLVLGVCDDSYFE